MVNCLFGKEASVVRFYLGAPLYGRLCNRGSCVRLESGTSLTARGSIPPTFRQIKFMEIIYYKEVGTDWEVKLKLPDSSTVILRIPKDMLEYDKEYPIYLNLVFSGHYY